MYHSIYRKFRGAIAEAQVTSEQKRVQAEQLIGNFLVQYGQKLKFKRLSLGFLETIHKISGHMHDRLSAH